MAKETIAVDVDEVLADQAGAFVQWSNQKWGTHLTVADYHEHWAEIWGVDHHEVEKRYIDYNQDGVPARLPAHEPAKEVLQKLSQNFKLVVLTSRWQMLSSDTKQWIERHYQNIFNEVHHSKIWDSGPSTGNEVHRTKAQAFAEIGADYLIDDQLKHCQAVGALGKTALLFGDYPWNQADILPEGVIRTPNWPSVDRYFSEKAR